MNPFDRTTQARVSALFLPSSIRTPTSPPTWEFSMSSAIPRRTNMSRLLIRVLALSCIAECFILCPSPKVRPASAAPPPGYVLVWSDEFSGTALDLTKWGHLHPGQARDGRNAVQAIDAVSVSGGNLVIRTYSDYDPTNPDPPL